MASPEKQTEVNNRKTWAALSLPSTHGLNAALVGVSRGGKRLPQPPPKMAASPSETSSRRKKASEQDPSNIDEDLDALFNGFEARTSPKKQFLQTRSLEEEFEELFGDIPDASPKAACSRVDAADTVLPSLSGRDCGEKEAIQFTLEPEESLDHSLDHSLDREGFKDGSQVNDQVDDEVDDEVNDKIADEADGSGDVANKKLPQLPTRSISRKARLPAILDDTKFHSQRGQPHLRNRSTSNSSNEGETRRVPQAPISRARTRSTQERLDKAKQRREVSTAEKQLFLERARQKEEERQQKALNAKSRQSSTSSVEERITQVQQRRTELENAAIESLTKQLELKEIQFAKRQAELAAAAEKEAATRHGKQKDMMERHQQVNQSCRVTVDFLSC